MRPVVLGGLGPLCARGAEKRFFALYSVDGAPRERCAQFIAPVERAAARL